MAVSPRASSAAGTSSATATSTSSATSTESRRRSRRSSTTRTAPRASRCCTTRTARSAISSRRTAWPSARRSPPAPSATITGTNFTGATSVKFNGQSASFTVNSSTQITATVPNCSSSGTISVTTAGGTANSSTSFSVTGCTVQQQLLGNPGFETGSASPWVATTGVINSSTAEPAHSGSWDAWLDGYGTTHTDSIYQDVTIPSTATTATLSFWLHIDTSETTTVTAFDTLKVQIRNTAGTVLSTLATFSNLNKATGFSQKSFDVTSFKGQTIQVFLVGTEDSSLQTSFVVDDFTLNVQ